MNSPRAIGSDRAETIIYIYKVQVRVHHIKVALFLVLFTIFDCASISGGKFTEKPLRLYENLLFFYL